MNTVLVLKCKVSIDSQAFKKSFKVWVCGLRVSVFPSENV